LEHLGDVILPGALSLTHPPSPKALNSLIPLFQLKILYESNPRKMKEKDFQKKEEKKKRRKRKEGKRRRR
jgi:NADH:ubiquinone oxidoreductase subunit B-like Fe-S oxidoreductase